MLLFCQAGTLYGQKKSDCQFEISGQIFDLDSKESIPYVTIQIENTINGVTANEYGEFHIENICHEEFNLIISHVGHKTTIHHHDIYHNSIEVFLATDDVILESVVIEAEKSAGGLSSVSVSSIKLEEFELVQSGNLGEVVEQIAGVSTISTGQNIVKPVLHGLHSNRILIVNNGIRHEFQNWGVEHAPEIDPSLADNLEVIKGAGTVRYGSDALGGVILINPPEIEHSKHLHGELKLTGNSNGRSGESTMKLQKGFDRLGIMAEGSILKQGDLKAANYNLTNTGKEEISFASGINYHFTNFDLEAYYSHFNQELGILRGSVTGNLTDLADAIGNELPQNTEPFSYDTNNPRQDVSHDLLKFKGSLNKPNQSVSFQYGFQLNKRNEFDVRRGTNNDVPSIKLELKTHSIDLDWNHPEINGINGLIGIQTQYQDNNNLPGTNTISFIPNYNNSRFGIFIIESLEKGLNTFEAGLRYDYQYTSVRGRDQQNEIFREELTFQNVTATVGLKRQLTQNATFRTNLGTAWRPPSVADLYRLGKNEFINETGLLRFELDENNEVATTVLSTNEKTVPNEVGVKWINTFEVATKRYNLEVTAYLNFIKNYIYSRPAGITTTVRGPFPFFIFQQTDALLAGIDLNMTLEHSDNLLSSIRGNYLWSKDIGNDDFFVGQPPAYISYNINYVLPIKLFDKSTVGTTFNYTFRQFQAPRVVSITEILEAELSNEDLFANDGSNFDILKEPTGYFLTNLFWRSTIRKFNWTFQVKNLFNVDYRSYTNRQRYFADALGRNFIISINYKL